MATDKKIIGKMGWVQLLGILLLLVVLPLGSWYYLQKGLDYRLETRAQLQPLGEVPGVLQLVNADGERTSAAEIADYLMVGYFFHPDTSGLVSTFRKLYDQYDEREDVYFTLLSRDTSAGMARSAWAFLESAEMTDLEQVYWGAGGATADLMDQLQLSDRSPGTAFFADSSVVKSIYDLRQSEAVKDLVRHITLNLHPLEEKDIIFEREKEK